MAAVERSEALALAALEGEAPRVWMVLTTRTATLDVSAFYESFRQFVRAVRRRWPAAEYAAIVEFTTGYGPRSGGLQRPHWNVVWIGLGPDELAELEELVARVWCSRADAEARAQFVGEISEVGGLMRYLALHFLKESQAPPVGWRGHRFRSSRGFFPEGAAVAREKARASLNAKRLRHRLARELELDGQELEDAALAAERERKGRTWAVVRVPGGKPDGSVAPNWQEVKRSHRSSPVPDGWVMRRGRLVHTGTGEVWR